MSAHESTMSSHPAPSGTGTGTGTGTMTVVDRRAVSRSVTWAVIAFVLSSLLAALLMGGERLPLAGEGSLGSLAAWIAGVCGGLAFAGSSLLETRHGVLPWRRRLPLAKRLLDEAALTLAVAMFTYLAVMAVASLFQLGFIGLTVDPFGGGVLAGAAAAMAAYVAVHFGARITSEGIAVLATLVLFMGTMASMLSAPDQSWWQLHFSELGNSAGVSASRFNLALMITGLTLTVLANYIANDIERGMRRRGADPKRVPLFAWLFAGIGLCLMVVGLVPDAVNFFIHVGAASGMVVVFGVFVFCALRMLPDLPREVSGFSLVVVVGILIAAALWVPIGYYNLTGMEFIAAALLFAWLTVFVRAMAVYAGEAVPATGG